MQRTNLPRHFHPRAASITNGKRDEKYRWQNIEKSSGTGIGEAGARHTDEIADDTSNNNNNNNCMHR
jgi:hypothetical protein